MPKNSKNKKSKEELDPKASSPSKPKERLSKRVSRKTGISLRTSFSVRYFALFAMVMLVVVFALGAVLLGVFSRYYTSSARSNLETNVSMIADEVEATMTPEDLTTGYSAEKEMLCGTLDMIYENTRSDIYVCDIDGNVVLCRDRSQSDNDTAFAECATHDDINITRDDIETLSESDDGNGLHIRGNYSVAAGKVLTYNGEIMGAVFAESASRYLAPVSVVVRVFILAAFVCLFAGYILIYYLTRNMVKPLRQMSAAAKQFATGDFSYRIKAEGYDEIVELSEAFNDMASSLDALESSRSSFVANVSHELKTPMTTISGFIDGILDGTIPREKQTYYLNEVSKEVHRLSHLVVSMLNMSKIETGEVVVNASNIDLSGQLISIFLSFEKAIEDKNIDIRGLDDLAPCTLSADHDMIYQAFYNLVDNAVKFTNDGGYIEVNKTDTGDFCEISIKNSGHGIPEEDLPKIFDRFYKVDKSRSLDANGSGLGLYMVKLIIELHGGSITAESDGKTYSCFTVSLPKQYKALKEKGSANNE